MRNRRLRSISCGIIALLASTLLLTSGHASGADVWAESGEFEDGWQTYVSQDYGFALEYPAGWKVETGNLHNNSLPPDTTSLCSQRGVFDVNVIPFRKGAFVSSLDLMDNAAQAFWGSVSQVESGMRLVHGQEVGRAVYQKPAYEGIAVQIAITALSTEVADYLVVTQLGVDPISHMPSSLEYDDRLQTYERILQGLTLFPQQAKSPLPTFSVIEALDSGLNTDSEAAASGLDVAPFWWPTDGVFGLLAYDTPVSVYAWNNYRHPGVDVLTNAQGTGDGRNPRYPSMGSDVYPVYEGTIVDWILDPRNGAKIGMIISHPNVNGEALWTTYWHLADEASGATFISDGLSPQQQVSPTTKLGNQGDRRYGTSGSITTHLHFSVLTGYPGTHYESFRIDPSPYFHRSVTHGSVDRSTPIRHEPPCPKSGGGSFVVFYEGANYTCGGQGEGVGYVAVPAPTIACPFLPPDPVILPLEHRPLSVRVPQGYYIKVHDRWDTNATATIYGSDPNLWDGYFWSPLLGPRPIYSNVGSVEVYCNGCVSGQSLAAAGGTCPANTSPLAPSPQSPPAGHVALDYRAPTLCWRNSGDVDGDQLQFYAEVFNSPVNANSGWIDGLCWRPGQLDYQYHSYQWRVKARDARGAESSWSSASNFTIAAPNRPPDISFDTANGTSFTAAGIDSNAATWTFAGTASDPEGRLGRIAFRCSGDGCGDQAAHANGANWSHTRANMVGRNDVYFEAFDVEGHNRYSRHLDLRIDLAPPVTTVSLNDDSHAPNWPAWFTGHVQVRLQAQDGATGRARSGVQEIRYRLDGGAWESQPAESASWVLGADGAHTVEYYSVDRVGNAEGPRSITFQIDQTPPGPPSGAAETSGVVTDQWQKNQDTPTFSWASSTDATSGVWGYQLYFGEDPAGQAYRTFAASDPRSWTPQPAGVHTGVYYLRGRARDNAGNWSAWADLFTFRYDGTPPENPVDILHSAPITSTVWQRQSNAADFTWPAPHDEGSGIQGYYTYWGLDPDGVSDNLLTTSSFTDPTPLCAVDGSCTGYLRLRSVDNVDNPANEWSTGFVLRYDNAPPTVDFTFSGGITVTYQTQVVLDLQAVDLGSGVNAMRFSGDGLAWTDWEAYSPRKLWSLPGISRQSWPVYVQVKDGVDLTSAVVTHAIYLDVNPKQSRSQSFRLFDRALSAGAGPAATDAWTGRSTVGQVTDAAMATSTHFILVGGYEAGSQALPLIEPGHGDYLFVNGMFGSASGASAMLSARFVALGAAGEPALPVETTSIVNAGFRHTPGFLAAQPSRRGDGETPPAGPPPAPPPEPECQVATIRINDGAAFTNDLEATLSLCAPQAAEMMVSNDPTFVGASWEPYTRLKSWTLAATGAAAAPRTVYVTFREAGGEVYEQYFDDIVYDPNLPTGSLLVGDPVPLDQARSQSQTAATVRQPFRTASRAYTSQAGPVSFAQPVPILTSASGEAVTFYLDSYDDNSGVAEMQLSASPAFTDTVWQPFVPEMAWTPTGEDGFKTVYARVRDGAGNISATTEASFVYDTEPPGGAVALEPRIVGPSVITQSLSLIAWDNASGVADVRISHNATFTGTAWQPYTYTLDLPAVPVAQEPLPRYVQYRDWAGNVSEVYSATYALDITSPVVYAEVGSGETLTRTVTVLTYDELSDLSTISLSNDPLMIEGVFTRPYTDTISWGFDERRTVWVVVADVVGNHSEPYPAYAAEALAPAAVALTISEDDAGTILTWEHLATNARYEVWRSTNPYLDPDEPEGNLEGIAILEPPTEGTSMTYEDATGDYYYLVRSLNTLGAHADSIRVGRLEFQLVPGSN